MKKKQLVSSYLPIPVIRCLDAARGPISRSTYIHILIEKGMSVRNSGLNQPDVIKVSQKPGEGHPDESRHNDAKETANSSTTETLNHLPQVYRVRSRGWNRNISDNFKAHWQPLYRTVNGIAVLRYVGRSGCNPDASPSEVPRPCQAKIPQREK